MTLIKNKNTVMKSLQKLVLLSGAKGQRTAEPQLCRKEPRTPEAKLGTQSQSYPLSRGIISRTKIVFSSTV